MKIDCTALFVRYREITRVVWNLGVMPDVDIEIGPLYNEAMDRLFEVMVLFPLRINRRVDGDVAGLGSAASFVVAVTESDAVELWIDEKLPGSPAHEWGPVNLSLSPDAYEFKFSNFFDWGYYGAKDCQFVVVNITRLDHLQHAVGHQGLLKFSSCSFWYDA